MSAAESSRLLLDNDFRVLGVSVRDPVTRIVEAASDLMLAAPSEKVERARLRLTNPRSRVAAEVAWLPGVAPSRATQLVDALSSGRIDPHALDGLPAAPKANILFAELENAHPRDAAEACRLIEAALSAADSLDADEIVRDINEDRSVSRIPPIRSTEAIQDALDAQRDLFVQALVRLVDRLPTAELIACLTLVVESASAVGLAGRSDVLERLLATYETQALCYLEPEAQAIRQLARAILDNASKGEAHIAAAILRLEKMLLGWDEVAQPIQLVRQAYGDGHAMSRDLAQDVRGVAVDLFNEHGLQNAAQSITKVLSGVFKELPELRDRLEEDVVTLEDIRASPVKREEAVAEQAYSAKIGLGQTLLSISSREIVWGSDRYDVDAVDRVRWGGTSHSINGIPTGTTYLIAFGAGARSTEVTTRNREVFQAFTSRLWRMCGVPIAVRMLATLREGGQLRIGEINFANDGVTLIKSKFMAKPEVRVFPWGEVHIWSASGEFFVGARTEKGFTAKASYQTDANTHVLANLLHSAFDRGITRLSDVLS